MIRVFSFVILMVSLISRGQCEERAPDILVEAVRCLTVKSFLEKGGTGLSFGFLLDGHSHPGDEVLYVVRYAAPGRPDGTVFQLFVTRNTQHISFNIQNNADFVVSADDRYGISFFDPPLGGTWTQRHLALAINEIEKRPRYATPVDGSAATALGVYCQSYTDH